MDARGIRAAIWSDGVLEPTILKPPRLLKGDTIGIIAPAGPVTPAEIEPNIKLLESFGHEVMPSSHLYDREGYLAGNDDKRLEDLHSMLQNADIKAIFSARGGYGTLRLLKRINFDLIRSTPKIILGYSDITALLLAFYKQTSLVTFHGTVMRELSKNRKRNLESFLELVYSDNLLKLDLRYGSALKPGKADGILVGGNLSLICHLIGTPFMPSLKRSILFIEEKGEPLYRIDRMLTHLKLSGHLEGIAGLITGNFEDCEDASSINQILLNTVSDLDIPVANGLPVGHGEENICLPVGVRASIDTEARTLSILEPCITDSNGS